MAHPAIGIKLTHNGRVYFDYPPGQTPRQRCLAVLGEELAEQELVDQLQAQRSRLEAILANISDAVLAVAVGLVTVLTLAGELRLGVLSSPDASRALLAALSLALVRWLA